MSRYDDGGRHMLMKIYDDEDMIKVYDDEKIGRRCK